MSRIATPGFANPMTAAGSIIGGGANGVPTEVTSANGQTFENISGVLTAVAKDLVFGGRCTLSSGNGVYNPQPATPSSTDTTAETVTFASAHGWTTGTMIYVNTTAGGLTAATIYYINALSGTTAAFYTTLANAIADTSRVNLTANITSEVRPVGIQQTTFIYTPFVHDRISLYDGTQWQTVTFTEKSVSLTATASTLYYMYGTLSGGTLSLDNASTTAPTLLNGVMVKTGDNTRLLLGIGWCVATNTFEDSGGAGAYAGNRCLLSWYNRRLAHIRMCPGYLDDNAGTSYATSSATYTPANAGTGAQSLVVASGEDSASFSVLYNTSNNSAGAINRCGIAFDSTTSPFHATLVTIPTNVNFSGALTVATTLTQGKHTINLLISNTAGTPTWFADTGRVGGSFDPPATGIDGTVMI